MRCMRHGGAQRCMRCQQLCHWFAREQRLFGVRVNGEARRLCIRCAAAAGLRSQWVPASKEACRLFCMLNTLSPSSPPIEHVHLEVQSGVWVGDEVEGLAHARRLRPDGVQRGAQGEVTVCWFYHGCAWHGYPCDHPAHNKLLRAKGGASGPEAYAITMADMACFQANGLQVRYVWSVEFDLFWKVRVANQRPTVELPSIVHVL